MAIGGRTLGIVSGLAVGLVFCVFLVVLNPIISKLGDATVTQPIDKLVVLSELEKKTDTALPKRSEEDAAPETIKKVEIEVITKKQQKLRLQIKQFEYVIEHIHKEYFCAKHYHFIRPWMTRQQVTRDSIKLDSI